MRTIIPAGLLFVVSALAGTPVAAQTESVLQPFRAACTRHMASNPVDARLPASNVLDVLLQNNGVQWSGELVNAYLATVSGDALLGDTLARVSNGEVQSGIGQDLRVYRLTILDRPTPGQMSATGRAAGDLSDDAWVEAYLGGQLDLLQIHCPPASRTETPERRLIITGDVASLSQAGLAQREFATIGYTNNLETSSESYSVDVVVGVGAFEVLSARWVPFVSYERQTALSTTTNDLTFGITGFWRGDYHEVRWAGEYETDDQFESTVYRGSLDWDPPAPPCGTVFEYPARLVCRYGFRADYLQVVDPGSKVSLTNADSFMRAGGWVSLRYGRPLLDGWFQIAVDYELMEPISGDEGDAARGRVAASLSPSQTSHYQFSLVYENGEDITSLVRSETIKLSLGVRY
jgi:hypothetical protein